MSYTSNYNLNQRLSYLESEISHITPIPVGGYNLENVLTIGDDANSLSITNLNDLGVTTINGSAYPPASVASVDITDTNTAGTYYPTFVDSAGSAKVLRADIGTTPFSINPNTGDFNVADTLKITQTNLSIGKNAGITTQGANSVAVGVEAGQTTQGSGCVAVGRRAGYNNQGNGAGGNCIAIGNLAGVTNQAGDTVAIGSQAGETNQGRRAIAIGNGAGYTTQDRDAVAIGFSAGSTAQGSNSIAIGREAGSENLPANSICINATGGAFNPATAGFFVNPIASDSTKQQQVQYNITTKEISYARQVISPVTTSGLNIEGNLALISATSGGGSGNYLVVVINGVNYKIRLELP